MHTKLGRPDVEPNQCAVNLSVTHVLHVETVSDNPSCTLEEQLKAFWNLESLGIGNEERTLCDDFTGVKFVTAAHNFEAITYSMRTVESENT